MAAGVSCYFPVDFSVLLKEVTSCLLAGILLEYWLFISIYKAHILHDHILGPLIHPIPTLNNYLTNY